MTSDYEKNQKARPELTVFTVNWFSVDFIEHLFLNLNEKAGAPDRIEYLVVDNTHGGDKEITRLMQTELPVKLCSYDAKGKTGSFAHALGLNFALSKVQTEYALVVDPDVYVFKDKWDCFSIDEIETKNCSAIGTTFPPWQLGKYHNFPNPVFCLFRTKDFKMLNADWSPYSKNRCINLYNFVRRLVLRGGLLINRKRYQDCPIIRKVWTSLERAIGVCSPDTGWRIAKNAKQKHTGAILLEAVSPGDKVKGSGTTAFRDLAGEFELYYYRNEPILTHRYGTCSYVWRTPQGANTEFWRTCIQSFQNEIAKDKGQPN